MTPARDLRTGRPYWLAQPHPRIPVSTLRSDRRTDIAIIGAGITGAMAAEELTAAGFKVLLLDHRPPMMGATAATTALLQYEIDTPLIHLQKKIGADNAMRAWRRSKLALESLAGKLHSLNIRCDASRIPALYLSGDLLNAPELEEEAEARRYIGPHNDYLTRTQIIERFGIHRSAALHSFGSLSVNPLKMTGGFLKHSISRGAEILRARVTSVDTHHKGVTLHTDTGYHIEARHCIYATGYEMPREFMGSKHRIHSTYAITTHVQKKLWPERALIWEAADPYLYVRTTPDDRVICGGVDEAFISDEKRDALLSRKTRSLEIKLKKLFPHLDARAAFSWCGSFGVSDTGLPTIGPVPGKKHCYAILAFGGNGITFSRLAAEILRNTLTGTPDPDASLFAF